MKQALFYFFIFRVCFLSAWEVSVYPHSYIMKQFAETDAAFRWRWEKYGGCREFSLYTPNKTPEDLQNEFQSLSNLRFSIWYNQPPGFYDLVEVNEDFLFSDALFYEDRFRSGNCLAFAYNNTHSSFNSSNIVIGANCFLAMEGTRSMEEKAFFSLLASYQVTHLVRLTPEYDVRRKCHPYWKNRREKTENGTFFHLPLRGGSRFPIHYYEVENWVDHQGMDPRSLIELIQNIRSTYDLEKDLIAVHCSSGVGRTGTFIAAFILLNEIDRQVMQGMPVHLSIEELVLKLSLQRKYMVSHLAQYQTLYDVVKLYLEDYIQTNYKLDI